MKTFIAIVIVGVAVALPTFAKIKMAVPYINTPAVVLYQDQSASGDYQIYKYSDVDANCYVAIITKYQTNPSISCVKK